ncbi:MAG: choice-of-anchor D domain-containing protein [Terriglobales bacterium]
MNLTKALRLTAGLAFGMVFVTAPASAGTITYTCDPSVAAATCSYLNTTVAGNYSSTFTNANANIYITYGTTGLAQSQGDFEFVTYDQYVAALTSISSPSLVQASALSALSTYDAGPYGGGNVNVTLALAAALGITGDIQGGAVGITPDGDDCTPGTAGCYNAIVTVTNDPSTPLYYDNLGGPEPSDAYDFYGVVEHETDEVLGTSSCISTTSINPADVGTRATLRTVKNVSRFTHPDSSGLTDYCGDGVPSAVDLFRYSGAGHLVLDKSLSTKPGAYFSYNGGTTNGANGVANTPKVYNTLANGDDYADFLSSTPDCGTDIAVQDAEGCPGEDKGLSILNDGGGEINILNAVGYDRVATVSGTLTASPTSLQFGNVDLCRTKKEVLTLQNNGTTEVQIGAVSFTNVSGNPSDFSFHRYCNVNSNGELAPGKSCTIAVLFSPDALTTDTATLNIVNSSPDSPLQVPITAAGAPNPNGCR